MPVKPFSLPLLMLLVGGTSGPKTTIRGATDCREQPAVQDLLRLGEDKRQPYQSRKEAYENALKACSGDTSLYAALSALLLEQQDAEAALTWVKRGLSLAPNDPILTLYKGVALLSSGHPDQALAALKKVPPTGQSEFYLGMAYRALREHQQAQQALSKAFAMGFDDPYVLYVLIEQDRELGDKEAGLRHFRTFYDRFPDSVWLHMLYGDAYLAKNDDSNAEAEYEQALKVKPDLPVVNYQLGYIAFKRGKYAAAEEHLRKEIALNPTFAAAYLYLGTTLRRLGKNAEALPFLEQAVTRDPNYTLAYSELATAQTEAGKLEGALRTLQTGEERFPQEAAFPAQLAGLLRRLGRTEEAKREAEKATSLSKQGNPIQHGIKAESVSNASPHEDQKTLNNPATAETLPPERQAAGTSRRINQDLTSVRSHDPATETRAALSPALQSLAQCLEHSDPKCATQAMAAIQGPVKESGEYFELEARTLALERRRDEALAAIAKALRKEPGRYSYLMTQGQIYQSFNDQVSAVRSFLLADRARPHSSETFYFLGMSFFFVEEYPRAEKHFLHALALNPQNHRAAFMLGVVKMVTFKLQEGKAYFEEALKQQPENPFYHLHYGILLSRMGDIENGIAQVRTAEKLDPSYALTHYNLGHLYKEKGDYQAAKEELETAVRLRPGLAEAYYQLGTVYQRLGRSEDSRKAYQLFQTARVEEKRQVLDPVESNVLRHEP
jgi:tetratricopeptide (TPR) repeat protein